MKNMIKNIFSSHFLLVYKNENNQVKTYEISKPKLQNSFGNSSESRGNVGFKAYCYGRKQVRAFRHDRIVSLTKC